MRPPDPEKAGRPRVLVRLREALPGPRGATVRGDGLGALTAWALIVPECVAYAQIAGVPPQNAFYAAPVALVAYVLLGRSRFLIIGATSAAAVLSGATVAGISSDPGRAVGLSAALAVLAGGVLLAAGLARLGFVTNFLAEPALYGFLFGMALTIVIRQAAKIVGVSSGDGQFFPRLWTVLRHAPDWSVASLAVGGTALVALFAIERYLPKVPASLLVLAVALAVSAPAGLKDHGVEVVGKIPSAVPVPHLPGIPAEDWWKLAAGACGVALVVFAEAYSIASRFAREHGDEVDANREMAAIGVANIAVGLFRGFTVSGSASRSAAATNAGARSQLTSLIAAGLILLTGAFLTPLFTDLPEPVLGAIVVVAVRGFLSTAELRRYAAADRASLWVALTALVGVLLFDLLPGLLLAVALSLALFIAAASTTHLAVLGQLPGSRRYGDTAQHPEAATTPGVLVVRPDGQLFFGNADRTRQGVLALAAAAHPAPRTVVLDLSSTYHLGIPVLDTLDELREALHRQGTELRLARLRARARADFDQHRLANRLAPGTVHPDVDDAISAAREPSSPDREE